MFLQCSHGSVAPGKGFLATLMIDSSGAYSRDWHRGPRQGGEPDTDSQLHPTPRDGAAVYRDRN